MELTLEDFSNDEAESQINETETTETNNEQAESETQEEQKQPESEKPQTEETVESKPEEAESEQEVYNPDFTYKVKDEVKEFPEWLKSAIGNKELEQEARDWFTKIDAFDGIKEARTKVETEFNEYKNLVETQVTPTIEKIGKFDHSIRVGDFGKAFELAEINPEKVVDYLLMDEKTTDMVFKKALEVVELQNNGPQALEAKRQSHQESIQTGNLQAENQSLQMKLSQIEADNYNQMLSFTLSQHQEIANKYDTQRGQGAFENLVRDYGHMKWIKGEKLTPAQAVSGAMEMLGLQVGTQESTPAATTTNPSEPVIKQKTPDTLPNLTGGSNSSVVGTSANTWDEYMKKIAS